MSILDTEVQDEHEEDEDEDGDGGRVFRVRMNSAKKKVTILSEASPPYNHQHRGLLYYPFLCLLLAINYIVTYSFLATPFSALFPFLLASGLMCLKLD